MNEDEERIDELRALWHGLPAAPAPGAADEDLAAADPATRAVVARLQEAWRQRNTVVPELPFALRRAAALRRRGEPSRPHVRRIIPWVAAAAVILAAAWLVTYDRGPSISATTDVATTEAQSPEPHAPQQGPFSPQAGPRALQPEPLPPAPVAAVVDVPRERFALRADGFEFESEGVRIVLLDRGGKD